MLLKLQHISIIFSETNLFVYKRLKILDIRLRRVKLNNFRCHFYELCISIKILKKSNFESSRRLEFSKLNVFANVNVCKIHRKARLNANLKIFFSHQISMWFVKNSIFDYLKFLIACFKSHFCTIRLINFWCFVVSSSRNVFQNRYQKICKIQIIHRRKQSFSKNHCKRNQNEKNSW